MKICIVVDDYLSHSTKVAAKMMHELALELSKNKIQVLVITPDVEKVNKNSDEINIEDFEGINVLRFPSGNLKKVSKPVRLLNEILLSHNAHKHVNEWIKKNHFDGIIFYSPSIFWGAFIEKLKKTWKCKSFLVLRDFFPQWVIDNGIISKYSPLIILFRYFENKLYKSADSIGIQSPANLKWFSEKYPNEKNKSILLYNWASPLQLESQKKSFRKTHGLEDKIIFFYGGNIGHAQDMKNLLFLAGSYKTYNNVVFIFLGSGDEVQLVKDFIIEKELKNTIYLEPVSQNEFIHILEEVDVGLFALHPSHKTHNFPGKILAYTQLGLPILGVVNEGNDLLEIINKSNSGRASIAGDHSTLFEISKVFLDTNSRKEMSIRSNNLMNDYFSTKTIMEMILSKLER